MDRSNLVQITRRHRLTEEEFYPLIESMYEEIWGRLFPPQVLTDGLSNTVRNNVITPADTPIPDCVSCGACCASLLCVGIRPGEEISEADHWELAAENEPSVVVDRYMKRNPDTLACIALEGTVGEQVGCRIYESRPSMCHHFEAGSDRCHAIRRAYGIDPFLTLDEMTNALNRRQGSAAEGRNARTIRNAKIEHDDEEGHLKISAQLVNGEFIRIHSYSPEDETWHQFEFDGLSLEEADRLIRSRKNSPKDV